MYICIYTYLMASLSFRMASVLLTQKELLKVTLYLYFLKWCYEELLKTNGIAL